MSLPQTPPTSRKTRPAVATPPKFRLNDVPTTPNMDNGFQTPNTNKKVVNFLQTPNTSTKHKQQLKTPVGSRRPAKVLPPTPDFTPHKNQRRRKQKDTITHVNTFPQSPEQLRTEPSFGMLLPTPSTVGSGRKVAKNLSRVFLKAPPVLDFDMDNYDYAEEDEVADNPFNTKMLVNERLSALKESFASPQNENQCDDILPATPKRQVIDETLVRHWHGKSYNHEFSSDDDSDVEITQTKVSNPFVSSRPKKMVVSPISRKSDIDYRTHNEFINNKTGKVKVVELLERERNLRPRKLDFSMA